MPSPQPAGSAPQGDGAGIAYVSRPGDIHNAVVDVAIHIRRRSVRIKIDHVFCSAHDALIKINGGGTRSKAIGSCGGDSWRRGNARLYVKSNIRGKSFRGRNRTGRTLGDGDRVGNSHTVQ